MSKYNCDRENKAICANKTNKPCPICYEKFGEVVEDSSILSCCHIYIILMLPTRNIMRITRKSLYDDDKHSKKISVNSPSDTGVPDASKMATIPTSVSMEKFNFSNFLFSYHQVAYLLCFSPFKVVVSQEIGSNSGKYQIRTSRPQKVKFIREN